MIPAARIQAACALSAAAFAAAAAGSLTSESHEDTRDGADTGPVTAPHEARSKLLTYGLNHDVARCRVMSRSMSRAGTAANLLAEHEFPEPSVMSRAVAQIRGYWSEPIF